MLHRDTFDMTAPMGVPGIDKTPVDVAHLPGIVIFVHGVNSDGEWYEAAEEGLVRGLNRRLALDRSASAERLRAAQYAPELLPNGDLNRQIDGQNFIVDAGRSPVIRFRWGYKAAGMDGTPGAVDERDEYGSKIYLNEMDAWGGGPFQNGTNALNYMWGPGVDDRIYWWLYANMFPVDGREVYASPPRAYFVHAAHRLKELIKAIRAKQLDCPITVVCHSQGNMVTLAAALLGEREDAVADTYVLCNPPYSLESLGMDNLTNHDSQSEAGHFGGVTTLARQTTFRNFLDLVKRRAGQGQTQELINRYHGFKDRESGALRYQLSEFPSDPKAAPTPGIDRDNRGRVFLYCNPHDQVIGISPVKGIGWRGVDAVQMEKIGGEGVLYQRVWAMPGGGQSPPFAVGAAAWTGRPYNYLADNHNPQQFWSPPPPALRFVFTTNERQNFLSKITTYGTGVFVYLVTRLAAFRINDDPPKTWAVHINAPMLLEPVTPRTNRYGREIDFDEGQDPAMHALAKADKKEAVLAGDFEDLYEPSGLGDASSERALRYEHRARLKRMQLAAKKADWTMSGEEQRSALRRMMEENPNATDHSTILTNATHAERVLAYDVAVGWVNPSRITADDLHFFRQFGHWMLVHEELGKALPCAVPFVQYWRRGFHEGKQLQRTYNIDHMRENAAVADERERVWYGTFKG